MMDMTRGLNEDTLLLRGIATGDVASYSALYLKYSPRVRSFAYQLTRSMEDADDITHNIFLKLWERREKVEEIKSIKSYLFRSSKNAIFDLFKSRKRVVSQSESLQIIYDDMIEGRIDRDDMEILIDMVVEAMPKERKTIFRMNRYEGLSYKEIAVILHLSPKTVQYHISNALSEIKRVLTSITLLFF